jgi:ribonuclease-3
MDLVKFQALIGVRFQNCDLLRQALTHRSYVNEHADEGLPDNERMEFLGDAVLAFLTADLLYREFPDMPEGELTRLRAALVRTEALADLATQCDLGEALLIGKGEGA